MVGLLNSDKELKLRTFIEQNIEKGAEISLVLSYAKLQLD
jgi:hypothetical protein